jgi:hypothetical protein
VLRSGTSIIGNVGINKNAVAVGPAALEALHVGRSAFSNQEPVDGIEPADETVEAACATGR